MKKRKKRKKIGTDFLLSLCLGAAVAFGLSGLAAAQGKAADKVQPGSTRTIEGQVLTEAGAGAPGAVVLLKDNKTLQIRSYIAQAGGAYHFFGLSSDVNYTLRAENRELTSKQKAVSVFDSHRIIHLNLKLNKKIQPPKK